VHGVHGVGWSAVEPPFGSVHTSSGHSRQPCARDATVMQAPTFGHVGVGIESMARACFKNVVGDAYGGWSFVAVAPSTCCNARDTK
jgi:hypothetical protein